MKPFLTSVVLATASFLPAQAPGDRPIDLAICLDISGSMDGLLNAARQNLWAVVNELATLKPAPRLRVALLTYGCNAHDRERGWVKVDSAFTTDLDLVSAKLFALKTDGGEEYVGRVLQAALTELEWTKDPRALGLIFVAGNEPASQDPAVDFKAQCRAAIARGIVVNSIYCGNPADKEAPGWKEIAQLADGKFAAIDQDRGTVVATPFDGQLAELSAAINKTYLPFGKEGATLAENQAAQDRNAAGLNTAAAAARCQTKGGSLYWNAGWDLVDACRDEKFKLEEIKPEDLPATMRSMTTEQRKACVAEHKKQRDELKAKIDTLGKQRDGYVQQELARQSAAGKAVFEQAVLEAVRGQASARGFTRDGAAPRAESRPAPVPAFDEVVAKIAREYRSYTLASGHARMAPTDCRIPVPPAVASGAGGEHGGKLFLLYASTKAGEPYLEPGTPAPVGQTLVKESWTAEKGPPAGSTEAAKRYVVAPIAKRAGEAFHAGSYVGCS
jgi:hypothetical protein